MAWFRKQLSSFLFICLQILKFTPENHFDRNDLETALEKAEELCQQVCKWHTFLFSVLSSFALSLPPSQVLYQLPLWESQTETTHNLRLKKLKTFVNRQVNSWFPFLPPSLRSSLPHRFSLPRSLLFSLPSPLSYSTSSCPFRLDSQCRCFSQHLVSVLVLSTQSRLLYV